tara:strand:- start:367 stop:777 length:411 start_codon:yes stop_codon:yes gene_type:complete
MESTCTKVVWDSFKWRGIPKLYLNKISALNNLPHKRDAAIGLQKILKTFAKECGYFPDDVHYRPPKEQEPITWAAHAVTFEGGPTDWGIHLSFLLTNDSWYTEPYWGFDLHFCDDIVVGGLRIRMKEAIKENGSNA